MFASFSPFNALYLIIPFEVFRVLCSDTVTFKLKNFFTFNRFSVCVFLFVSTNNVLFFSFLTDFGVPKIASICFQLQRVTNL